MKSAALRAQVESTLGPGFPSPFTFREKDAPGLISCGVSEIDSVAGGLPRGGLTEIFGPASSGRTSLVFSMVADMTAREEVCALVDTQDAFDPHSAQAAGVELERLLWVRCHNIEQALKAADLLLQGGGFGLVALDLSDVAPQTARGVPLSSWFRFRRAVEHTSTVLVLLEREPYAKTCASLVLRLEPHTVYWSALGSGARGWRLGVREDPQPLTANSYLTSNPVPHASLLRGARLNVEVIRFRLQGGQFETRNSQFETRLL